MLNVIYLWYRQIIIHINKITNKFVSFGYYAYPSITAQSYLTSETITKIYCESVFYLLSVWEN